MACKHWVFGPVGAVAELEAENAALRARVAELTVQLEVVAGKLADLERRLGRNSSNSSKPPSTDPGSDKSARPENANRKARRAMGRKQGKQPGTPGFTLSQVGDRARPSLRRHFDGRRSVDR